MSTRVEKDATHTYVRLWFVAMSVVSRALPWLGAATGVAGLWYWQFNQRSVLMRHPARLAKTYGRVEYDLRGLSPTVQTSFLADVNCQVPVCQMTSMAPPGLWVFVNPESKGLVRMQSLSTARAKLEPSQDGVTAEATSLKTVDVFRIPGFGAYDHGICWKRNSVVRSPPSL